MMKFATEKTYEIWQAYETITHAQDILNFSSPLKTVPFLNRNYRNITSR